MRAESGCNASAYNLNTNGTTDEGLLQINSIHVDSGLITSGGRLNPTENVAAAYRIYVGSGWHAWSSYNSGKYLRFM